MGLVAVHWGGGGKGVRVVVCIVVVLDHHFPHMNQASAAVADSGFAAVYH